MIKILYDYQIFSMQQFGGISRYFANLHQHFQNEKEGISTLGVKFSNNHYISSFNTPFNSYIASLLSKHKIHKWNRWYSNDLIGKNDYDIFHPTYYDPYFLKKIKKPFVVTIHDMIHEIFPDYFEPDNVYSFYKRQLIEKATHIIAISASTKNDLVRFADIPEEKISIVYHGFNAPVLSTNPHLSAAPEKYILFVGDRRVYKNFARFIYGIQPLMKKKRAMRLICAGGGPFQLAEWELLKRNKIEDSCTQVNVSDADLFRLYAHAAIFVFPSLYEGFGFPLLEAFNAGCPVAASNTSCFKEVGGEAAVYFDPYSVDDISAAITAVIDNTEFTKKLTANGQLQLKKFTIEKCVERTGEVYKKML